MKLNDAVVLVTGANRGLGKELVQAALRAGARRVYAGARDPATLADVRSDVVLPLALDITDPASLAAAAERAPDVTVLFNNAGVLGGFSVLGDLEGTQRDFVVNVFGTLACTRAFLPALERAGAAGGAAIMNVLSVVSLSSIPVLGGYGASKAASYSLTLALRAELKAKNITVHAALPGVIDTDMVRAFPMEGKTSPAVVAQGIVAGVEAGEEEIAPDPMSHELVSLWRRDPKQLERTLANMNG